MTIKVGDILFVDTNVLLTATDESRPQHAMARGVFAAANCSGFHLGLSGQIIREYLVVATRPHDQNGLGLRPDEALSNVAAFRRRVLFFDETDAVSQRLCRLVRDSGVQGKRIHDTNVVATMLTHGVSTLVTENQDDFAAFAEVNPVSLSDALRTMTAPPTPG